MKPCLSLSLDADNLWSYLKTHGDPGWESHPSYLDCLAEIALERLHRHGLCITFFVVGQDAALAKNHAALRALAEAGHEIANHSFRHEPWLHEYSRQEVELEILQAEEAILVATGRRTRGFRGPGFSLSRDVVETLQSRGYLYDASTFPTFVGPLARAYYFMKSRGLSPQERRRRSRLFGTWRDGLRPLDAYAWGAGAQRLVEIPVTTMPVFRVPIHLSYLLYLSGFSRLAARAYLGAALALCRATGTSPSFLLHPLDLLGKDLVQGLDFFPGMQLETRLKLEIFDQVVAALARAFEIVSMEEHANRLLADERLCSQGLEALALP